MTTCAPATRSNCSSRPATRSVKRRISARLSSNSSQEDPWIWGGSSDGMATIGRSGKGDRCGEGWFTVEGSPTSKDASQDEELARWSQARRSPRRASPRPRACWVSVASPTVETRAAESRMDSPDRSSWDSPRMTFVTTGGSLGDPRMPQGAEGTPTDPPATANALCMVLAYQAGHRAVYERVRVLCVGFGEALFACRLRDARKLADQTPARSDYGQGSRETPPGRGRGASAGIVLALVPPPWGLVSCSSSEWE